MDYSKILQELEEASLFDLYRMSSAINDELANSQRINEIKQSLRVGQEVTWLEHSTNRLERAVIEKCTPSRCEVKNLSDGKRWRILYASINLNEVDTSIHSNQKFGVKKSALRVGDIVSFLDKENKLQFAKVTKLNPKTAGLVTMENVKWRVYYENLSKITDIDADVINKQELEYQQWLQNNQGLLQQSKHPDILDNVVGDFLEE
jgi:hypothetical protein